MELRALHGPITSITFPLPQLGSFILLSLSVLTPAEFRRESLGHLADLHRFTSRAGALPRLSDGYARLPCLSRSNKPFVSLAKREEVHHEQIQHLR